MVHLDITPTCIFDALNGYSGTQKASACRVASSLELYQTPGSDEPRAADHLTGFPMRVSLPAAIIKPNLCDWALQIIEGNKPVAKIRPLAA
jgi:hypothetical protein